MQRPSSPPHLWPRRPSRSSRRAVHRTRALYSGYCDAATPSAAYTPSQNGVYDRDLPRGSRAAHSLLRALLWVSHLIGRHCRILRAHCLRT
jgi:hypothetical protein